MSTVQIEAQLSPDELLKAVGQLSAPELDVFAERVLALRAERRAPHLSAEETQLLSRINPGLPADMQARFDHLVERRRAEALTAAEHAELLRLIDQIEQLDADRLELLVELARLRGVSLQTLVKQIGLDRRRHD